MKSSKLLKQSVLIAIAAVVDTICTRPLDDIPTGELAGQMKINRKLLQEGFRQIVGMRIKEYRNMKRMEIAQQFLAEGSKSIKEIAGLCRYQSQSAFTTAFRKLYGMSPTEWQEQQASITIIHHS